MRNISENGLAKLAAKRGNTPITIVEVDWSGSPVSYADRDLPGIPGRIFEVSEIDNVVGISQNDSSQEMTITLADPDGDIKNILDTHDVHQRNVRVYQYFEGLELSDKFLILAGKLSSPITWSEGSRTVTFSVVSQLEDREFGFSAEEGQFPFVPKDLIGKPWPVIFGKVLDVPALRVNKAVTGTTLCGVGVISGEEDHLNAGYGEDDCGFGVSMAQMSAQIHHLSAVAASLNCGGDVEGARSALEQAQGIREQQAQTAAQYHAGRACAKSKRRATIDDAKEKGLGCNPVRILGGEDFPQETTISLKIGSGIFTGKMSNDSFKISTRRVPEDDDRREKTLPTYLFRGLDPCSSNTSSGGCQWDHVTQVPCGCGDQGPSDCIVRNKGFCFCSSPGRPDPRDSGVDQVASHRWFEPGTRVSMASDEPITFIVSIVPGEVLAVKAFKTFEGVRKLVNVPNDLWRVETVNYGPITAVQVVTRRPLSTITDQGWEDDIYVTFESSVGPDIVDILKYIITNWTDLTWDDESFDYVQERLIPFPANFAVLTRKNTIDVLREIAFQARCALWINNGVFHMKYLPEQPTPDDTMTVSDMFHQSVEVSLTDTEDLVTKMVGTWWLSWADDDPNRIILRHNVNKYGTKEREFEFYIYNQPDIVLKVMTFWLIRMSNTWKKIRFSAPLTKLRLEAFDTVMLDLPPYVANGPIRGIIEEATYNSDSYNIDIECWVPVKAGTMSQYKFAWPSKLSVTDVFPTPEEVAAGNAGGGGIGAGAEGELPIGYTDGINTGGTVFVGGPNVAFGQQSDHGDRRPTDVGFTPQTIIPDTVYAEVTNIENPNPSLKLNFMDKFTPPEIRMNIDGEMTIDIRHTKIVDSDRRGPNNFTSLADFIDRVEGGEIYLKTNTKYTDVDNQTGEFDFKFDSEGGKFGAGTAFLKEEGS